MSRKKLVMLAFAILVVSFMSLNCLAEAPANESVSESICDSLKRIDLAFHESFIRFDFASAEAASNPEQVEAFSNPDWGPFVDPRG